MKKLFMITVLLITLLSSCDLWEADLVEFLEYYSTTAGIGFYELDGEYPSVNGVVHIPGGDSRKIVFAMRNPKKFDLDFNIESWHSAPLGDTEPVRDVDYTLIQGPYDYMTMTLTPAFLEKLESNPTYGDISATISLASSETGRAFDPYSYTLMVNSPPPEVINAQFAKATTNGSETWWLCFNAPAKEGIHPDIETITIDGSAYMYDDDRFIKVAPSGLKDTLGNTLALSGDTQRYINTNLASNVNLIRTITVTDSRGLSSSTVTVNTGDIPIVISPTISATPADNTGNKTVTLSSLTEGATIYYTTNGSSPTTASTKYTSPFTVNIKDNAVTVQAIAVRTGMTDSSVASYTFLQMVASPIINASGADGEGNKIVTISTTTTDATIYYTTDGSTPATAVGSGTKQYTGPFSVNVTNANTLITAIAVKEGMTNSALKSYNVTSANTVNTPSFNLANTSLVASGTPLTITSNGSEKIYYTTGSNAFDRANPTENGWIDYAAIPPVINFSAGVTSITYRAIATATDMIDSSIVSASYTQAKVATPVISVENALGEEQTTVFVTNDKLVIEALGSPQIFYTTGSSNFSDGDWIEYDPNNKPNVFSATYKAIAIESGKLNSEITEKSYSLKTLIRDEDIDEADAISVYEDYYTVSGTWAIENGESAFENAAMNIYSDYVGTDSLSIPAVIKNAILITNVNLTASSVSYADTNIGEKNVTITLKAESGCVFENRTDTKEIPITFTVKSISSVTFLANGGDSSPGELTYITGDTPLRLPETIPTRSNYNFIGWSTTNSGFDNLVTFPYSPINDITLYAIWDETTGGTYTTFDPGDYDATGDTVFITGDTGLTDAVNIPPYINGKPVTSINGDSFKENTDITSVIIPNTVTSIGDLAFDTCSALTSVTIPNSVTSIGRNAFINCGSLISITIPDSVTSIAAGAFQRCSTLTSVTIPASVTSIGNYLFYNCTSLTSITVDPNNPNYKSEKGILYTYDGKILVQYPEGKTATSFEIPNGVTEIAPGAFAYSSNLKSIIIPDGVTTIGFQSFDACSGLTSITIPGTTTTIASNAFRSCTGLESITIPASVTSIGHSAFSNCKLLESVTVQREKIGSLTTLDAEAFLNTHTSLLIYVPSSVLNEYKELPNWSTYATENRIKDVADKP